jgi:hypothetical protein
MRKTIAILFGQVLMAASLLPGQIIVSSIVGDVADPSGALVPGAQVTVTNTQTGIATSATTGPQGTYSVPGLLAGTYTVTITRSGFAPYKATNIVLPSAETVRLDAQLAMGGEQQAITVASSAPMVHTDEMSVSGSVTQQQLADLPTSIQTIDAALTTAPGVMPYGATPSTGTTTPAVGGGTHWGAVNFTLNGMEVNDPFNSGPVVVQGAGMLMLPPPSALQELNVQAADMNAQYRGHSTVTLVTKAGTNKFHGEAYEYVETTDLNANQYALNAVGKPRPIDHLNQFGGNVGGPIWRDKAFFFADYSGYRHVFESVTQLNFPGTAMRGGNFSALCSAFNTSGICTTGTQLYNPFTGQPFINNQITSSLITSQASTLLKFLPAPTTANTPGLPSETPNYISTDHTTANIDGAEMRIDYAVSAKDRIFGVYAQRVASPWGTAATTYPNNYGQSINDYSERNVSGSEMHIFSANAINELRASWGDYATLFGGQNLNFDSTSLWPQDTESIFHGLPTIAVSGYTGMWHDAGTGFYTPRKDVEFNDDFTLVHGPHNFQAGMDEIGYKLWYRVPSVANVTGAFTSTGNWTGNAGWPTQPHSAGNAFADFLIGVGTSAQTSAQGEYASYLFSRDWGVYAQDTWQISPRLTLIYGLRYEYQTSWHHRTQTVTSFDPVNDKLVLPEDSATPTLPNGGTAALFAAYPYETTQAIGLSTHFDKADGDNLAPRLGFAFRPFNNQRTVIRGGFGIYYNFQPAALGPGTEAFNPPWTLGITQSFTSKLPGKPTAPFLPDITFSNPYPSVSGSTAITANPTIDYFQRDFKNAISNEWNLTVEQQIKANWVVRASFLGNVSDHLPYNGLDFNGIVHQQPNVPTQNQRPYQPFSTITSYFSYGREEYNQLQLGVRKRFSDGSSFEGEYQYTRSLDDISTAGGPEIPGDYMGDWGNSDGIRRHWAVFNYDYQVPFGRNGHWLRNANALANALIGGWQVSGITTYGTGVPLINLTFSQTGTGIVGWSSGRPDRVPGVDIYAGKQSGHNIIKGVQWFNPAAFAPPAKWTYGDAARNMLFGPGYWNWDISTMKTFDVHEPWTLQLRADFLDAFNHLNLANPGVSISDTRDGGSPVATSGVITSGTGNRVMQLSGKIRF